ncbi:hypothetical protein BD770DRAFT_408833 [Pilaira anomala]|nr:hypothetical protein BD770DRAFT_408833 [Pilaira anomala]
MTYFKNVEHTSVNKLKLITCLQFRLSIECKQVQDWSCNWGAREDTMLLFGVYVHGFGSWLYMEADTTLGLNDKLFIGGNDSDEKQTPKAIHLVRRADQWMKILEEEDRARHELLDISDKRW